MQDILDQTKIIVDAISPKEFHSLCSTSVPKRSLAIEKILSGIDSKDSDFWNLFQAIPIEFVKRWELICALYFIETNIRNGNIFGWEIVKSVIETVISLRQLSIEEWDIEIVWTVTNVLHSVFWLLSTVDRYKNNPDLYLLMGNDAECIHEPTGAIDTYNTARDLGSIDAYFRLANVYESQGNTTLAISILRDGYGWLWDVSFLPHIIRMLSKDGKKDEAYWYYQELLEQTPKGTNPFIVYKWFIENDADLRSFESLMAQYQQEEIFEPNSILLDLSISASVYIGNEFDKESKLISLYNVVASENWAVEYSEYYAKGLYRRLALMQTHIIALKDDRYLDFYLKEIYILILRGSPSAQEAFCEFFQEHFSPQVAAEYTKFYQNEDSESDDNDIEINQNYTGSTNEMNLFEAIRMHLITISTIFWQWPYHEVLSKKISPMVDICLKMEWKYEEIDTETAHYNLNLIKNEQNFYNNFPLWLQGSYTEFIQCFDKKYGINYRNTIQSVARNKEYNKTGIVDILEAHPDIALLFWIEKIIQWWLFEPDEETDLDRIIRWYHLDALNPSDALLFAGFLFAGESQYEVAIELLINIPFILDFPRALAFITESLLCIKDGSEKMAILTTLHELSQKEYDGTDFFDQINDINLDVLEAAEASDEDRWAILLAMINSQIIQGNSMERAEEFLGLAKQCNSQECQAKIARIYQEEWDYLKTIEILEESHRMNPSVTWLKYLISATIMFSQFDKAKTYIDLAIENNYEVSGYIFAWHLGQGEEREAIKKMITILQSDWQLDSTAPEGTRELLISTIENILNRSEDTMESGELKILATYLNLRLFRDYTCVDGELLSIHLAHLAGLLHACTSDTLHQGIENSIWFIACEGLELADIDNSFDKSVYYIHTHGMNLYNLFDNLFENAKKTSNVEQMEWITSSINRLIEAMIFIFQHFPETEDYQWEWLLRSVPNSSYVHNMTDTLQ